MSKATVQTGTPWQGAFDAVGKALDRLIKNPSPALFYIVILLAAEIAGFLLFGKSSKENVISFAVLQGAISLVLTPMVVRYQLEIAEGKQASSIGELLRNPFMIYLNLIAAIFVIFALVLVGILGLMIPMVWFIPWLSLLFFPLVRYKYNPVQALKMTRQITKGHLGKVWAVVGLSLLLSLGTFLTNAIPGLNTIVTAAVSLLYNTVFAMLYLWLEANNGTGTAKATSPVSKA